jgi:ELWxxDGT repeat protein
MLFFTADDGRNGWALWKSDGTDAGTILVKDIFSGQSDPYGETGPTNLTNVNGMVFFSAVDESSGRELWRSDGTAAGTIRVKDILPGAGYSYPDSLTNVGGTLFFAADDGVHGYELWKRDGTEAGTVLVQDLLPGADGSGPYALKVARDKLFFSAESSFCGRELWVAPLRALGVDIHEVFLPHVRR